MVDARISHFAADGTLLLEPLIARINRYLHKLIPYRTLYYDAGLRDYYVQVISQGPDHLTRHGPFYYCHMVGLARYINALSRGERIVNTITIKNRGGKLYEEKPLPRHLQFDVVTPALHDMLVQLRGKGWTVTPPAAITAGAVTGEVTDAPSEAVTVTADDPEFLSEAAHKAQDIVVQPGELGIMQDLLGPSLDLVHELAVDEALGIDLETGEAR